MVTIRCRHLQPLGSHLLRQPLGSHLQPLAQAATWQPLADTCPKWLQQVAAKWLPEQVVAAKWLQVADISKITMMHVCSLSAILKKRKIYKHTFFSSSRWHIAANGYDSLQTAAATWQPLGSHLLRQPLGSLLAASWQPLGSLLAATWQPLAATWQPLADTCPKWLQQVAAKWLPEQVAAKWLQVADISKITMMHVCSLSAISTFGWSNIWLNIFDFLLLFARLRQEAKLTSHKIYDICQG